MVAIKDYTRWHLLPSPNQQLASALSTICGCTWIILSLAVKTDLCQQVIHIYINLISPDYIFDTSKPRPAAVFSGETRLIALPAAKSSGSNFGDGCSPIDSTISVAAKIVLVQRGSCLFSVKARNIQQAGGIGVVISDDTNETAVITPSVSDPTITIPVIFISEASAAFVFASMNATASGGAECILTWPGDQRIAVVGDGSVAISDFSSYGPSSDFTLKPDIAAPGGMIFSTFPVVQGKYATLSGTSMSSPYITGSYSLLLQGSDLLRQISPVSLRPLLAQILLQNTATPIHQPTLNSSGVITTILKQGAGLVNVHKALQARTLAIPSKLALGALPRTEDNGTVSDSIVTTIQIVNLNNVTVDYALSSTPSEWINGSNPQSPQPLLLSSFNNVDVVVVSYSLSTLRVAASGVGSIDVTFKLNASMLPSLSTSDHWFFSGFLVIESNDTSTIRVPFVLESGSFKQQNALLSYPLPGSTTPFPQIFSPSTNATFTTSPTFPFQNFSSRIFTTASNLGSLLPTFSFARLNQFSYDAPVIRFRLLYGSPLVIIRLLDTNGTFVGEIARLTFIGRSDNSVTNGFLEVAWYGDIRISAIDVTPLPPPPTTIVSVYGTAASTHALSLMRRDGLTSNGASMFLQLHDALLAQLPSFSTSNDSTPTVGPLPLTSSSLVTNGIYSLELQVYSPQLGSNYFESWKSPFIRVLLSNGPAWINFYLILLVRQWNFNELTSCDCRQVKLRTKVTTEAPLQSLDQHGGRQYHFVICGVGTLCGSAHLLWILLLLACRWKETGKWVRGSKVGKEVTSEYGAEWWRRGWPGGFGIFDFWRCADVSFDWKRCTLWLVLVVYVLFQRVHQLLVDCLLRRPRMFCSCKDVEFHHQVTFERESVFMESAIQAWFIEQNQKRFIVDVRETDLRFVIKCAHVLRMFCGWCFVIDPSSTFELQFAAFILSLILDFNLHLAIMLRSHNFHYRYLIVRILILRLVNCIVGNDGQKLCSKSTLIRWTLACSSFPSFSRHIMFWQRIGLLPTCLPSRLRSLPSS